MLVVKDNINGTVLDNFIAICGTCLELCIIGCFQCDSFGKFSTLIE